LLSDLRYGLRTLSRAPGFAIAVVLTLALGIGANTGAFTALNALLLKPLPYPHPEQLVALYETTVDGRPRGVAEANLLDWRRRTSLFDAMAAYQPRSFGLTFGERDAVTVIRTGMVMADFFRVLRVPPAAGRTFSEEAETAEAHLLVLTDRAWRRWFADGSGAIGRTVFLNEEPYTVIGVMPAGFEFPMDRATPDAFLPLSRRDYCCGRLGAQDAVARLRPGATLSRARAELASVAAAFAAGYPSTNGGRSAGLQPLGDAMNVRRREPLRLLMGAATLLLLIACANVGGLVLARGLTRLPEFTLRMALGAGPIRMARQSLAEAALLAAAGSLLALAIAELVLRIVPQFIESPRLHAGGSTLGFAMALAAAITLLLGIAPAWVALRRRVVRTRAAGWSALVVAQVALCVVLLLSSMLLLRSLRHLAAVDPGFDSTHAFRFGIGLPEKRYDDGLKLIAFHRELLRRLEELPAVERAGAALRLPLRGGTAGPGGTFQIAGENIPLPQRPRAWVNAVTPGYFEAMRIPLVEGRAFAYSEDRPRYRRVAVVNQTFARTYLRGRRPLGTRLDVRWVSDLNPDGSLWEIVGIAADTRQASLDRDPVPEIYLSQSQVGAEGGVYVIRYLGDGAGLAAAIAKTVAGLDPRIQRVSPEPLNRVVGQNLGSRNAAVRLVGGSGALALLLTAIGISGIVSYRAAERSREMAIRAAIGASPGEIRRLVVGHGVALAVVGTVAGLAAFASVLPMLRSQLFGVQPGDPASVAAVAAAVLAVAVGASLGPSRRTSRLDLMKMLKEQ
jgi:predicted permease